MGLFSQVIILGIILNAVFCENNTKVVDTTQGKVEGNLASSRLYYEFLGIRYGVPVKFRVRNIIFWI